jgi:hypothetical protein
VGRSKTLRVANINQQSLPCGQLLLRLRYVDALKLFHGGFSSKAKKVTKLPPL